MREKHAALIGVCVWLLLSNNLWNLRFGSYWKVDFLCIFDNTIAKNSICKANTWILNIVHTKALKHFRNEKDINNQPSMP